MKIRFFTLSVTALALGSGTDASACLVLPDASAEVTMDRALIYQSQLWSQSTSVFIARSQQPSRNANGFRAVLVPVIELKGQHVGKPIVISHTGFTMCGPTPRLAALNGHSDEYFVVYSSAADAAAGAIAATVPLSQLVDPNALQSWSTASNPPPENQ